MIHPHDALMAISQGRSADPFAILGLHEIGGEYWLCAFDPGAEGLVVLPADGGEYTATATAVAGVFVAKLPRQTAYRLRWHGHGSQWEVEDPYAFPPVLGELDEYLLAEGSHARLWHVLGAHPMIHQGVKGTN